MRRWIAIAPTGSSGRGAWRLCFEGPSVLSTASSDLCRRLTPLKIRESRKKILHLKLQSQNPLTMQHKPRLQQGRRLR